MTRLATAHGQIEQVCVSGGFGVSTCNSCLCNRWLALCHNNQAKLELCWSIQHGFQTIVDHLSAAVVTLAKSSLLEFYIPQVVFARKVKGGSVSHIEARTGSSGLPAVGCNTNENNMLRQTFPSKRPLPRFVAARRKLLCRVEADSAPNA